MKRAFIAASAIGSALAIMATAAPAMAESDQTRGMVVQYDDLNLASKKGQKELERRIDRAAREICDTGRIQTGTRLRSNDSAKCYRAAKAMANNHMAKVIEDQRLGG